MGAAKTLRATRLASGVSITELARRGKTSKAAISQIERQHRGVTVDRLDSLLKLTRNRLVAIPSVAQTPAEIADEIRVSLAERKPARAFREFIGFASQLLAEKDTVRVALCLTPPPTVNNELYDAAIAGVVDFALRGLPKPDWLSHPQRAIDEPQILAEGSIRITPDSSEVPIELSRRGVLIDEASLTGV